MLSVVTTTFTRKAKMHRIQRLKNSRQLVKSLPPASPYPPILNPGQSPPRTQPLFHNSSPNPNLPPGLPFGQRAPSKCMWCYALRILSIGWIPHFCSTQKKW